MVFFRRKMYLNCSYFLPFHKEKRERNVMVVKCCVFTYTKCPFENSSFMFIAKKSCVDLDIQFDF